MGLNLFLLSFLVFDRETRTATFKSSRALEMFLAYVLQKDPLTFKFGAQELARPWEGLGISILWSSGHDFSDILRFKQSMMNLK